MKATREAVYSALDGERAYQEQKKTDNPANPHDHEIAAYLTYMRDYLTEAERVSSRDWGPDCDRRTLDVIRKVTALGVACMEEHGAPHREPATGKVSGPAKWTYKPEQAVTLDEIFADLIEALTPGQPTGAQPPRRALGALMVGDRVVGVGEYDGMNLGGRLGTVVERIEDLFGVRFDEADEEMHAMFGRCDKGHGWWCPQGNLIRVAD